MEFKGEILGYLLRIITPVVIAELSTASSGKTKKSLSQIMTKYDEMDEPGSSEGSSEAEAKVLPFGEALADEIDESLTYQCGQRVHGLFQEFSKLCLEMESQVLGASRLPKKKISNCVNSSDQLIEQKKKFENSYALIKSQEVLSLYKTVSKVNVIKEEKTLEKTKAKDKDFLSDREKGILINKKQA
jgi:hypothetical protein